MESRWPPKSPHEALLSSPSGRNRVRQLYSRTSPSPSPLKRPQPEQLLRSGLCEAGVGQAKNDDVQDATEDEDEEALTLKLQAIEAKLRLKRLRQKRKTGEEASTGTGNSDANPTTSKENVPPSVRSHNSHRDAKRIVQVQASPRRKTASASEPRSPGRVLLGIDKGLKGSSVSLRRPGKQLHDFEDPFQSRTRSTGKGNAVQSNFRPPSPSPSSRKSFGDRLAESRKNDNARLERQVSLRAQRSDGFGIAQFEIDASREKLERSAADQEERRRRQQQGSDQSRDGFSREQIMKAIKKSDPGVIHRSRRSKKSGSEHDPESTKIWMNPNAEPEVCQSVKDEPKKSASDDRTASTTLTATTNPSPQTQSDEPSEHLFESFTTLHLSKRHLTHDLLTRSFQGKSVMRLVDLLANIKSPDYLLPENMDADFVVVGVIATKSSPLSHKDSSMSTKEAAPTALEEADTTAQNAKGKFMVLQLTDLKWTVDLYLFTTAYTRFYKLTPGTVIAILNPGIMPPPRHKTDTGRFSLTLHSSDDTILEIGTARDLGWCKAVRKDGKQCPDWIDKRHTEFCEFHVDRVVENTRRGRMEVNGMSAPFAPGIGKKGRTGNFGGGGGRGTGPKSRSGTFSDKSERSRNDGLRKEGQRYDRTTSSNFFVAPPIPGFSTANLLDREDMMANRSGNAQERARKRLAEREKEKEIAKELGNRGDGAGSQYLRVRQSSEVESTSLAQSSQGEAECGASSLGLLGNRAVNMQLSPLKKTSLKRKDVLAIESARKKTRFVTEKGIRIAGRESFGRPGLEGGDFNNDHDDDDDGLVIE